MATKLQRLLGLAPLESLRTRASRDMEMERPINNYFGQQQSPEVLAPLNIQSPTQSFFNQEMQNIGLQRPNDVYRFGPDQVGGDTGGGTGGYGDIDEDEGSGLNIPTGSGDGDDDDGKFYTKPSDLMSNFLSGLGDRRANQLTGMLEDDTLDFDELATLAGFDINKLKAAQDGSYEKVKNALQGQFSQYANIFEQVPDQLRNLQELRSNVLGQEISDAQQAYGSLMDFVDQGSVSGIESGVRVEEEQEATQNLERALQQQLIGAEGQYLNELDSLLASTAGVFTSDAFVSIARDFVNANKGFGQYLNPGGGSGSGSGGVQTQGGFPSQYQSLYDSYGVRPQDITSVIQYYNQYFSNNGFFPTVGEIENYITQTLGYGQDEEEGDYYG